MNFPNFTFEDEHDGLVCGIDEVGRGPLAGPVVAAAVILKPQARLSPSLKRINDSKKISAKIRALICKDLSEIAYIGIGSANVEEIDEHNIFHATFIAMQRAYSNLCEATTPPTLALIDGNKSPKLVCNTKTVIKGDQKSFSIAAASIVAKTHRDALMSQLSQTHPEYGWERNAGYGTKQHIEALKRCGATPHHRKTFKPVSEVLSATY